MPGTFGTTTETPWRHDARERWYACRTRARAEKAVDRLLDGAGVESFLPLVEEERQWADRTKRVELPLFPGYIFARFATRDLTSVLSVQGMVDVVRMDGAPAPVREDELDSVQRLVDGVRQTGLLPHPADFLDVGDPVEVVEGAFAGLRGELVEVRGKARVAVRFPAIRQAVAVELPRRVLEPLRVPVT